MDVLPLCRSILAIFSYGLDPSMSAVKAALNLYEREAGPMPDKVSYAEKGTSKWRK